jgi:prepilin-type N-terminal cleavage/methylation domain-containing protein
MSRRKGFSLPELLVVISIIALLVSILLPALMRTRRQAQNVIGQSNLKQWGTCFSMYTGDWDGSAPRGWWQNSASGLQVKHTDYWMEALRPYYGNEHQLRCCPRAIKPSSEVRSGYYTGQLGALVGWGTFPGESGKPSSWWPAVTAGDYGSYGMNAWVCNPPPDAPEFQGHNVAKKNWRTFTTAGASQIPLLGDEQWIDCWPQAKDPVPPGDGEPWGPYANYGHMVRVCLNRHDGYVNWVFMDYSVKSVGLKGLWKLRWHRNYDLDSVPPEEEFNTAGDGWMRRFKDHLK